jgi:hypothetical protein
VVSVGPYLCAMCRMWMASDILENIQACVFKCKDLVNNLILYIFIYTSTSIKQSGFCAKTEILGSISACVILLYCKKSRIH